VKLQLKNRIEGVEERLDAKIDGVREELKETREELREEMSAGFKRIGEKACLCVNARRQVDGHEEHIVVLEKKVA